MPENATPSRAPTMATMPRWTDVEPILRDKAYRIIENDPQVLLEGDAWMGDQGAHLIYARLFGYEDEIVRDGWRLRRPEPQLLLPIIPRLTFAQETEPLEPLSHTARYVMQSGYAIVPVDPLIAPDVLDLLPEPPADFTVRVLYLRYRRRG